MTCRFAALAAACCTAACCALAAGSARAQAFAYAPGTHRYRITSMLTWTQEVGEQKMSDSAVSVQVISVVLAPASKDTLRFEYAVDSVRATLPQAQQLLAGMRGRKVTGLMSPQGEVFDFQMPNDRASPVGGQEYRSLRSFLLRFPNAGLRAGLRWADTVSNPFSNMGLEGTETTIVTSRVAGDTTIAGVRAWRVERTVTGTVSGSGTQNGQAIVLDGTRSVAGESYVSRSGVYLGSVSTQEVKTTMRDPASGRSVVITQSATSKIERIGPPTKS